MSTVRNGHKNTKSPPQQDSLCSSSTHYYPRYVAATLLFMIY